MIFKRNTHLTFCLNLILLLIVLSGCMRDDQWVEDHRQKGNFQFSPGGVFVINEGNFMYGNATLSFYDTLNKAVQNDLFYRANGLPLGDVAESMAIWKSKGYVVVNNSGKIYVMDIGNGKYTGKITGLTSPRFMHIVNDQKAYVTDLYAGEITIVNPSTNQISGHIPCPTHPSTEEMVQFENQLFVTCWSGDKTVLVIDIEKDVILAEIKTGEQPGGIVLDKFNKIWVLCQSSPGSGTGRQAQLQRIDPLTRTVDKNFNFPATDMPVKLSIDGRRENLYYLLANEVRKMSVSTDQLPDKPFVSTQAKILYGMGLDPHNGNIYVSDAVDYQQLGLITRFSESGIQLDHFKAGIIPGRFCFK